MMRLRSLLPIVGTCLVASAGCAKEETSDPPEVAFSVSFPSSAAAVATDNVKIYVFAGALRCNDLVRIRQTEQALPAVVAETSPLTPCQLASNQGNLLDRELELAKDYTMLAVGKVGTDDVFVGCAVQSAYGATLALPIDLTFIDDRQKLPKQACTKLSDKCNGLCR